MDSNLYPLSPERRARLEKEAALAEPYDVDEDELILDGDPVRSAATFARFILREDDKARAELTGVD